MQILVALALAFTWLLSGCDLRQDSPRSTSDNHAQQLLFTISGDHSSTQEAPVPEPELAVSFNPAIRDLAVGETAALMTPNDEQTIDLEITSRSLQKNGDVTLVGSTHHSTGEYRMVITSGPSGTFGRIRTPTTTYLITTTAGKTVLVDLQADGNEMVPKRPDDALIPPPERHRKQAVEDIPTTESAPTTAASPPDSDGRTTVDLMILYSPGMAAKHTDSLATRLNHLVAETNAAYEASEVAVHLRLVHSQEIDYPDDTTNYTALNTMTAGAEPFAAIESLRLLHGADLVTLLRPFSYADHGGCGIAWLLGYNGSFTGDASHAYSVVSEGSERVGSTTWYCSELTLAHELGHNLGSHHDRANASGAAPVYPYSYGYGIAGSFGTIMSYINPETDRFSNPDLTCLQHGDVSYSCGIDESAPDAANNALSLNNAASAIAGFRSARYLADINNDGLIDLADVFESLFIITEQEANDAGSRYQDINGDGRIGLEEAIYLLQLQHASQ